MQHHPRVIPVCREITALASEPYLPQAGLDEGTAPLGTPMPAPMRKDVRGRTDGAVQREGAVRGVIVLPDQRYLSRFRVLTIDVSRNSTSSAFNPQIAYRGSHSFAVFEAEPRGRVLQYSGKLHLVPRADRDASWPPLFSETCAAGPRQVRVDENRGRPIRSPFGLMVTKTRVSATQSCWRQSHVPQLPSPGRPSTPRTADLVALDVGDYEFRRYAVLPCDGTSRARLQLWFRRTDYHRNQMQCRCIRAVPSINN